jgi:hypothetical protein
MSHDPHGPQEVKPVISFKNAFWLVVILVGLFIGAIAFIQSESKSEEGEGKGGEKTEVKGMRETPGDVMEKAGSKEGAQPKPETPAPAADSAAKGAK